MSVKNSPSGVNGIKTMRSMIKSSVLNKNCKHRERKICIFGDEGCLITYQLLLIIEIYIKTRVHEAASYM